uniref:BTB domain-containing protein n=1 Tax=Rhabditophanes sp. KR3021 TaxID=114890 RepID=A0AC35TQR3_9BILA
MFYKNFPKLQGQSFYEDAILIFKDGFHLSVNRYILAAHNGYFHNLFLEHTTQERFDIDNISLENFQVYYTYIHHGFCFEVTTVNIFNLINIYSVFDDAVDLELSISSFLVECNKESVDWSFNINVYRKINSKIFDDIKETLTERLYEEFEQMSSYSQFEKIEFVDLHTFAAECLKEIDAFKILKLFYTWMAYDFEDRKKYSTFLDGKIKYDDDETQFHEFIKLNEVIYSVASHLNRAPIEDTKPNNIKEKTVILIGGIKSDSSILEYDNKSGEIKEKGELAFKRNSHCSEKIGDKIVTFGGKWTNNVETFDLKTSEVESHRNIKSANQVHSSSSCVIDSKIYSFGGMINKRMTDEVKYLDFQKMDWYSSENMPHPTMNHDSITFDSQVIYVTPGSMSSCIQRFDPRDNDSWKVLAQYPKNILKSAVTTYKGKYILMLGGILKQENVNNIQAYDIVADGWCDIDINLPECVSSSKAVEMNDRIYIFGGQVDKYSFTRNIYFLDIGESQWKEYENRHLLIANAFFSAVSF